MTQLQPGPRSRAWAPALAAALLAALVAALTLAGPVSSHVLYAPKKKVLFGVSDRGSVSEFREFSRVVGKHPAVLQTFHPWGNSLKKALPRWRTLKVAPMLHISTADDQTLEELLTPRAIARGYGDNYLLRLNRSFARHRIHVWVRPLGEPNRCLNVYSPFNCDGSSRDRAHSRHWVKQAFRRISLILHGGGKRQLIDRRLRKINLPPVERRGGPEPRFIPHAPVSIMWSPLPSGSPIMRGNKPGNFWPGGRYVDWVATDFYSKYPIWKALNRFYRIYAKRRDKPMALSEWAVWGADDPRFVRRIFAWTRRHARVRMIVYYRGFGEEGNEFRVGLYPRSLRVLRRKLDQRLYPARATYYLSPTGKS